MNFNKNTQICEIYLVNSKKYSTFAAQNKLCRRKGSYKYTKQQIKMTTFQSFYENVRVGDAQPIRNEVEKLVSQVTFLNWRRGTFEPAAQFWGEINHIAEKFGYEKPYKV